MGNVTHHAITLNCPPFLNDPTPGILSRGWCLTRMSGFVMAQIHRFSVYLDCQRPALGLERFPHAPVSGELRRLRCYFHNIFTLGTSAMMPVGRMVIAIQKCMLNVCFGGPRTMNFKWDMFFLLGSSCMGLFRCWKAAWMHEASVCRWPLGQRLPW